MSVNGDTKKRYDIDKVVIESVGDRIVLPQGMTGSDAIEAIARRDKQNDQVVSISETLPCFPLDGAVAFAEVLKERFGWVDLQAGESMWGKRPPLMIGVDVGPDKRIQVPWGDCSVPKIDGTLTTGYTEVDEMPVFRLHGAIKRKHESFVGEIVTDVKRHLQKNSIYKSKAIWINFRDKDGDRREFSASEGPRFLNLDELCAQEGIYSVIVEKSIELNIHFHIKNSEVCRKNNIPLKRGILIGGPYGTGKTLAAYKLARICEQNGWTFLYLKDVRDLPLAIKFARWYQPCAIFAEDVDRTACGPRTAEMDTLLNSMDGIDTKDSEIMIVATTNHMTAINPAFLRPGRFDSVINIGPPDLDAICRMIRVYGRNQAGESFITGTDEEIKKAVACLEGANAAFIRETTEYAKVSALHRSPDKAVVTPEDLKIASEIILPHIRLVNPDHGKKSLLELQEEMIDPIQFAGQVLMSKMAEAFVDQIANPKVLKGIVKKTFKSPFGNPGMN